MITSQGFVPAEKSSVNSSALRMIFVAARPYSGSTLLSFLANTHPEIATVGEGCCNEIEQPGSYLCSCGDLIADCPFWDAVVRDMQDKGYDFHTSNFGTRFDCISKNSWLGRFYGGSLRSNKLEDVRDSMLSLWPGYTEKMQQIAARNEALARSILAVSGRKVYFDASKFHITVRYLRKYSNIDLRVVHLVRDVRGATASFMRKIHGGTLRESVNAWIRGHRNIERQMEGMSPDKCLRIRYEDLCQFPEQTLTRLFEFCGVDPQLEVRDFRMAEHHIVGNHMRMSGAGTLKYDERWKRFLSDEQLLEIDRLAGHINARYGYSPITSRSPSVATIR